MEEARSCGETGRAAAFAYVGGASAAPVLTAALERLAGRRAKRAAVLIPDDSDGSCHTVEGSPARCREWLMDACPGGSVGVLWVVADPTAADMKEAEGARHGGLALRGHLSLVLLGRLAATGTLDGGADAELLADLVESRWIPPLQLAVARALTGQDGDFHLIAMTSNEPGRVICTSRGSTLCIGVREDGLIVCSEPDAVLSETSRIVFLHSGEIGVLDSEGCDLLAADALARLRRPVVDLGWYGTWARRRTMAPGPSGPAALERDRSEDGEARQEVGGGR